MIHQIPLGTIYNNRLKTSFCEPQKLLGTKSKHVLSIIKAIKKLRQSYCIVSEDLKYIE